MRKFLLLPALAILAALVSVIAVEAHSRPVRFDPEPGAVLATAPSEVTGWFTSDLRRADESFIKVFAADGNELKTGEVQLSTDRRQMSTSLQPVGEGRYVVYWSTFDDADGEVFAGCYAFYVGQTAADAAVTDGKALDGGADCPVVAGDSGSEDADHTHDDEEPDANTASVAISIPEVVDGDTATLEITPTNFTPRAPDGSTVDPNFGHYHIYLDKVPVDVLTGDHSHDAAEDDHEDGVASSTGSTSDHEDDMDVINPGGLAENPVMWVENSYTFTNLEPGYHTVSVVLNYDNHEPYDPAVIAAQTFRVEGAGASASNGGGDDSDGGVPAWTLALGVIGGLVVGGVGMKLAGSRA